MEEMNNEMMVEEKETEGRYEWGNEQPYEDQSDSSALGLGILVGGGAILGGLAVWGWGKIKKSKVGRKAKSFFKKDSEPLDVEAIEVDEAE